MSKTRLVLGSIFKTSTGLTTIEVTDGSFISNAATSNIWHGEKGGITEHDYVKDDKAEKGEDSELKTYFLHFIGQAEYKSVKEFSVDWKWTGKMIPTLTQICIGKLYIRKGVINSDHLEHLITEPVAMDDFKNELIFDALSGSAGNGLLPNGIYNLSIKLNPHKLKLKEGIHLLNGVKTNVYEEDKFSNNYKSDETGMSFKIALSPELQGFGLKVGIPRDNLLIHPIHTDSTDGCVGLSGGNIECLRFWSNYMLITKRQPKLKLYVTIDNNNNVSSKKFVNQ